MALRIYTDFREKFLSEGTKKGAWLLFAHCVNLQTIYPWMIQLGDISHA